MLSRLDVIVPPTSTVVDLATLKQFARVDDNSDDALLSNFITAVTDMAEKYTGRIFNSQVLSWTIARGHHGAQSQPLGFLGWQSGYGAWWPNYGVYNQWSISLPRSPVQEVLSVSRGYWGQDVDTFLDPSSDYNLDLQTTPERLQITSFGGFPCPDHLRVVFRAGYAQQNTLTALGVATVTATLAITIGGTALSVAVTAGDTAAVVMGNLYAALVAADDGPSASLITPLMMTLRGSNVAITASSIPAGLILTPGTPRSDIPPAVSQAILFGCTYMYQNLADPDSQLGDWFYRMLDNDALLGFA